MDDDGAPVTDLRDYMDRQDEKHRLLANAHQRFLNDLAAGMADFAMELLNAQDTEGNPAPIISREEALRIIDHASSSARKQNK